MILPSLEVASTIHEYLPAGKILSGINTGSSNNEEARISLLFSS